MQSQTTPFQNQISRENKGRVTSSSLTLPTRTEHVITVGGEDGESSARLLREELARRKASPQSLFIFGGGRAVPDAARLFPGFEHGISWLRGDGGAGGGVSAMQVFAGSGHPPAQVIRRGHAVGFVYEDDFARYCRLGSVVSTRTGASRESQSLDVFETAEAMLREGGFQFSDTVRTWFYLDRLLEWYTGFNAVRTAFFKSRDVFNHLVPASTGIGAGNAHGSALTCDLLAVQPKAGMSIRAVSSPLQDSAMLYKSSFSRAVELSTPAFRQLLISGTASIDKDGRTVHQGDSGAQVNLTMEVVEALLRSRGMDWQDVTRGIAYFKRMGDGPFLDDYFKKRAVTPFPLAVVEADICRDDLLFEIEVDAIRL